MQWRKMHWKKEGSTKGAKNRTQSYFLIKPNQTDHIHHQVHDHHHDDHDDQHEPRHVPICARDRGKAAVIPACPTLPLHPLPRCTSAHHTTVLKHCTPLLTTVLKHCTAFSYILSIQDVSTANLAVLEEPGLRAEQCKKSLLVAISVWK